MIGYVISLLKNPRYKFLYIENQYYLIDLQCNIISYIFPMINWFPKTCYKVDKTTYIDLQSTNQQSNSKTNYFLFVCGSSILLAAILRPIMKTVDFPVNPSIAIILVLLTLIAVISLHIIMRRKYSLSKQLKNNTRTKIKLIPNSKNFIALILFYFMTLFFSSLGVYMFLIELEVNLVFYFAWIIMILALTFSNILSISVGKLKAKVYN
ncbi:DUF443 family protein [Staphylococcus caeli]|uniref:Tandem five-TM family protein n=1 Tax=Staphylococcus caeli TaxID=2201815 RepID=A0A1D4LJT8_9STAP|nr:DUF443 family protein [Staphylococcus caeli]SCS66415.1 tandem five-TM family protein [Staphylococcus caeli]SCS86485.1 tandem five-TM family protein [Staphylococcus caeli]